MKRRLQQRACFSARRPLFFRHTSRGESGKGFVNQFPNRFLDAVQSRLGKNLAAQCEAVSLPTGMVLFDDVVQPRYVHFLTSGVASVITTMQAGNAVEIGMYGYDGFAETHALLGPLAGTKHCLMQVGGTALRLPLKQFRAQFLNDPEVRALVLEWLQFENLSFGQVAACNGLHEVEDRLARWLLMVQDRLGSPDLPLTQESIGEMLGTRRATVTMSAGNLQRSGLIEYHRGNIRVKDRERLEEVACECYGVLARMRAALFKT